MFTFVMLFNLLIQDLYINLSTAIKKNSLSIMGISGVLTWFLSKEPLLRSAIGIVSIYLVFITVLGTGIITWIKLYKAVFPNNKKAVNDTKEELNAADFTGQGTTE